MSSHGTDDKLAELDVSNAPGHSTPSTTDEHVGAGVDSAWKFLDEHRDAAAADVSVDLNALRRKIDWHIVPLMFLCYTMQFLDKVILNVSSLFGARAGLCSESL